MLHCFYKLRFFNVKKKCLIGTVKLPPGPTETGGRRQNLDAGPERSQLFGTARFVVFLSKVVTSGCVCVPQQPSFWQPSADGMFLIGRLTLNKYTDDGLSESMLGLKVICGLLDSGLTYEIRCDNFALALFHCSLAS